MKSSNPKTSSQKRPQALNLTNTTLIKYTLISFIFAVVTLVIIILPAEYNIDPTGIGSKLGLTAFNKVSVNTPQAILSPEISGKETNITEIIDLTVPAGRGIEYKFAMNQYQKLTYQWSTNGSALYFDLHGEPRGDNYSYTEGYFESYAIATLTEMKGSFTAPFSGMHGWYWKNNTDSSVTVKLVVTGSYAEHGLK